YVHEGTASIGVLGVEQQTVARLATPGGEDVNPEEMQQLLADTMDPGHRYGPRPESVPLSEVQLLAPMARPQRNVFCVGKNYVEHAQEFDSSGYDASVGAKDNAVPDFPIVFTKPFSTIIGPGAEIDPHLEVTQALDYEAEVALVIGRPGK